MGTSIHGVLYNKTEMTARKYSFLNHDNVYKLVLAEVLQPKQSVELWKTMFQSLLIWGTYIWGVLLFEWVLIFEKSVASVSMGTYNYLWGTCI